ncbi:uncharacterized protein LOC126833251 [Adelges cooleyi]|uniref:uncharacterized protein LOC126833251 n=1 Tax=Adelges cooleyi TaxID=133065 RepID=UPI0021806AEC|nr:uncharacterized protein LOC126833251 [Adelges cooleyi]XP_050420424.1 uncharacterized protein LOC126833251 [Adelges cooleyi]
MSSNTFRVHKQTAINNENPIKNIKDNQLKNRKNTALKVLTNTVQSSKKSNGKGLKIQKTVPMQKFVPEVQCSSTLQVLTHEQNEELTHFGCMSHQSEDTLPSSMTCNIAMLSDYFNTNTINDDKDDWFLEDYNKIMKDKIKNTFEYFGKPEIEVPLLSLPLMEFPEISFA